MDMISSYLIPLLYLYFAYRLIRHPAPFGENGGISTRRAKESEEIWNYVQRTAGNYCLVAAVCTALIVYLIAENYEEVTGTVYWVQIGIQVASIALFLPVVNYQKNRKFPKKK
ncbi:MAG: SdpI family protein [Oscillospiraceae bacterium]|nr:SdpI family protein [Oscillospiraceae bacterium]